MQGLHEPSRSEMVSPTSVATSQYAPFPTYSYWPHGEQEGGGTPPIQHIKAKLLGAPYARLN